VVVLDSISSVATSLGALSVAETLFNICQNQGGLYRTSSPRPTQRTEREKTQMVLLKTGSHAPRKGFSTSDVFISTKFSLVNRIINQSLSQGSTSSPKLSIRKRQANQSISRPVNWLTSQPITGRSDYQSNWEPVSQALASMATRKPGKQWRY
jgi:hypothetical protein